MRLSYLLLGGALLLAEPGWAQTTSTINTVKGGVVKTKAGNVLLFNKYHGQDLNFSLTLPKGDARATERPGFYELDGLPLQVLAVPVEPFKTDSATTTLKRYIGSEAAYQQEALQLTLAPFARQIPNESGRLYIIWGFPMPASLSQQVAQQLFLVFIDGDYIISLGSVQLQGQEISKPLDLLLAAARSYKSSPTPIKPK